MLRFSTLRFLERISQESTKAYSNALLEFMADYLNNLDGQPAEPLTTPHSVCGHNILICTRKDGGKELVYEDDCID